MREIKFRAWDGTRFYYFGLFDLDQRWSYVDYKRIPENVILQQFTGLKDKNGKEIYEGDVVSFETKPNTVKAVIFWGKYAWALDYGRPRGDMLSSVGEYAFEVVGNIYENPELLK